MTIMPSRVRVGGKLAIAFFACIIYHNINEISFMFAAFALSQQRTSAASETHKRLIGLGIVSE